MWNTTDENEVPFGLSFPPPELFSEETIINILVNLLLDLYLYFWVCLRVYVLDPCSVWHVSTQFSLQMWQPFPFWQLSLREGRESSGFTGNQGDSSRWSTSQHESSVCIFDLKWCKSFWMVSIRRFTTLSSRLHFRMTHNHRISPVLLGVQRIQKPFFAVADF